MNFLTRIEIYFIYAGKRERLHVVRQARIGKPACGTYRSSPRPGDRCTAASRPEVKVWNSLFLLGNAASAAESTSCARLIASPRPAQAPVAPANHATLRYSPRDNPMITRYYRAIDEIYNLDVSQYHCTAQVPHHDEEIAARNDTGGKPCRINSGVMPVLGASRAKAF